MIPAGARCNASLRAQPMVGYNRIVAGRRPFRCRRQADAGTAQSNLGVFEMRFTNARGVMLRSVASSLLVTGILVLGQPAAAADVSATQSPWFAVDRNRAAIVAAIVERWHDTAVAHAATPGVLSDAQLRDALQKLRADHLFSASLAGSYAAVLSTLSEAGALETASSKVNAKTGNPAPELVYTAITPCRIIDSRFAAGGSPTAGSTRNWLATNPAGSFAGQGGSATNCGIPVKAAAVTVNITIFNNATGPAYLVAWPFNKPQPTAATLNWVTPNTQLANSAVLPLCTGAGCTSDFSMFVSAGTDFVMDVVGYQSSPSGGNVLSVAPSGAQYSSIQAAIDAAIAMGAADGNSFIVKVAPGIYNEQVTLKDWVDVHGAGSTATGIVFTGTGPAVFAGAQSVVRDLGIFADDTVSNVAVAIQQNTTTAAGFPSLQWVAVGAVGPKDNVGLNVDNGFIHVLNSDIGTGPPGAGTNQTAIVASNAANVRFANGRLTPSLGGLTRVVAKQNAGAIIKIDNSELRGTTIGAPSCFAVFQQNYTAAACP